MSEVVGEAVYKIRTDETGVDFDGAGQRAGTAYGKGFGRTAAKLATGFIVGAVGVQAVRLIGDSVAAASDLAESTNKVQQIFGDATDSVLKFTSTSADKLGQTNVQAREAASTFGIFGKSAGFSDRENAKFAKRFTKLASDLASFNNTSPEQAIEAIGAAMRGESEPIRAYGVLLDEATLKAEALRLGILKPVKDQSKILSYQVRVTKAQQAYNDAVKKSGGDSLEALSAQAALGTAQTALTKATEGSVPPLTQQQKLLAAQSEILKQTGVAQGDFSRTSDGLANQQRRLSASIEDTKAKLGTALLPVAQEVAGFLLDKGVPAAEKFADSFTDDIVPAIGDFIHDAQPVAEKWLPKIVDGLETARDVGKDAAKFIGTLLTAFDKMPPWAQRVLIGGGVTAFAANKVGLSKLLGVPGGDGLTNTLLGRGSRVNPMNVFVTNPGFGLGGGSGVPITDEPNDPNRRRRPRRSPRIGPGLAIGAAFLAPEITDLILGDGTWDDITTRELDRKQKFFDKWGETLADQSQKARAQLADALDVDVAHNLGEGGFFGGIPGTDFFVSDDAKQGLTDALKDATGSALIDINADLHETFGVGLPRLAKAGMIDASVVVGLQVAKQQASVIASGRREVQEFRAGIEGDYTGRFTLLGIDTANAQINGMFDLFMRRNAALQSRFPAGGEGGADGPPNHNPTPDRGGELLSPTSSRQLSGDATVTIQHAHFHDWNDMQKQTRTHRRLASLGGRRVGTEIPA